MTREQIETILKAAQAKQDKEGAYALADGANMTVHVAHSGASLSIARVESMRFDGDLVYLRTAKQTATACTDDIFCVAYEGAGGAPARRPAGFG
ncbi:MAG: hypothetical protein KC657_29240 [Myxococcales bacterium]|nr:hypothetical protein [Myxococcales bacterium]